jgi:OOP family OmpA-OmpF porin
MESIGAKASGGVLVEGFTCDLGPEQFNLELAQRRSASVARVIRESAGGEKLAVVERAFGESHPVVPNETGASRKENRRVVVSLK